MTENILYLFFSNSKGGSQGENRLVLALHCDCPLRHCRSERFLRRRLYPHKMCCCYRLTFSMSQKNRYSPCLFIAALCKTAPGHKGTKLRRIISSSLHTALFTCPRQREIPVGRKRHLWFLCTGSASRGQTQTLHRRQQQCLQLPNPLLQV